MNTATTCTVCRRPLKSDEEIICAECAAPEIDGPYRCVVCSSPTSGTYRDMIPVCLACYAIGTDELREDGKLALYTAGCSGTGTSVLGWHD